MKGAGKRKREKGKGKGKRKRKGKGRWKKELKKSCTHGRTHGHSDDIILCPMLCIALDRQKCRARVH